MGLLLDPSRYLPRLETTADARAAAFNKYGIKRPSAGNGQATWSVLVQKGFSASRLRLGQTTE
jgi:hypothetical protein